MKVTNTFVPITVHSVLGSISTGFYATCFEIIKFDIKYYQRMYVHSLTALIRKSKCYFTSNNKLSGKSSREDKCRLRSYFK